jgi:hypothetical protein
MSSFIRIGSRVINLERVSSVAQIQSKEFGTSTTVEMGDPSQTYTIDGPQGEALWRYFCDRATALGDSSETSAD